jgi:rod shape-determining protein MreC
VPRHRTARIPVLASPASRSEGFRPKGGARARARAVAVGLVLVSLLLVTVYFRESSGGVLHEAQRVGISVLTPFEVAAERVARPFQDAWRWTSDLLTAKEENERLRGEVERLQRMVIENETAAAENERLIELLRFVGGKRFPRDYEPVATRVLVQPQNVFAEEVVVSAGSTDGIRIDDPVMTAQGLVGSVVAVARDAAKVRLLTDRQSAASAMVVETEAPGIVVDGPGESTLLLDRVSKEARVDEGNIVVTSGSRIDRYESLYPRGIPICVVESVSQRDVDLYKQVQCAPLVEFDSLHEVIVLVEKGRGG